MQAIWDHRDYRQLLLGCGISRHGSFLVLAWELSFFPALVRCRVQPEMEENCPENK